MKAVSSCLLFLLTLLVLGGGGLVVAAEAHSGQAPGVWAQQVSAEAGLDLLFVHPSDERPAATGACEQDGCSTEHVECCVDVAGAGCAFSAVCPGAALVAPAMATGDRLGIPSGAALGGVDPEAARRPPRILA